MTFLEELMSMTSDAESPQSYFYWSGLSAISAVLNNKVYLDKKLYKLYPNIFVILIGKSGLRKGVPVLIAKNLVEKCKVTRVMSGRTSIQKAISELSKGYSMEGGIVIKDSVGLLISSEFAAFLVEDKAALTILTDLYDGHYNEEWRNSLKSSGVEKLTNVNLTMLGASNPIHFRDVIPQNAIGGGFIARTMLIYADKKNKRNSLIGDANPIELFDYSRLVPYLKKISNLKGGFTISSGADLFYNVWYNQYSDEIERDDSDDTGTADRLHDHVLKVAMLISVSRKLDMVIEEQDIKEAIEACNQAHTWAHSAKAGTGKNPIGYAMQIVLEECIKGKDFTVTREKLLKSHWNDFDANVLDQVVNTLVEGRIIVTDMEGSKVTYTLSKAAIGAYREKGIIK